MHCPDVCATVGKTYRKKRQEAENTQRAGSKIRDRYILERDRAIESLQAEIAKLEVEWQVAGEKEKKAKAALEVAEAMDSKVIAQKMASRECSARARKCCMAGSLSIVLSLQRFMALSNRIRRRSRR